MISTLIVVLLCLGVAHAQVYNGGWDPNYCCYPVPETCCPAPTCPQCLDLAIAIDTSSSIGFDLRDRYVPFLQMFANDPRWTIGMAPNMGWTTGILKFNTNVILRWQFNGTENTDAATLTQAISAFTETRGLTATAKAFQVLREDIVGGPGNRPDCPDVCMILTDGVQTLSRGLNLTEQVLLTHQVCTETIVIGVTQSISQSDVEKLASSLPVSFYEADINNLFALYDPVSDAICNIAGPPSTDCCPYNNPLMIAVP